MRCVSLFSGCGGLDLGLQHAGFSIVLANDTDPVCAESHSHNFRDVPFHLASVATLDATGVGDAAGLKHPGELDLLAGGPPCPPFSKSRFYRKEKPRALDDGVAVETIGHYLRLLTELRPKAFLLENVKGFAYSVHRPALELVLSTARQLGYHCTWTVLNAADFGVPQIRERCFVVGSRVGAFVFPGPTHARNPAENLLSAGLAQWVSAGEAIGDLDSEENAGDVGHVAGGRYHDLLKLIPPGDNYLYFTAHRGHPDPVFRWRSRYWSFLLKLSPDLPSWTIQARRSNNMGPFHWRNRILRIEEVKRLQTFPDEFFLAGRVEDQWRQIGNAVPPLLAKRLGEALTDHLQGGIPVPCAA